MTKKIVARNCSVEGCGNKYASRGYCQKHGYRARKYGNPNVKGTPGCVAGSPVQRFWSKVAITADDEKCWLWLSTLSDAGYGIFTAGRKVRLFAHRFSWQLANGRAPKLNILHSCDTPSCVNPTHLREGTQAENVQDMWERGRANVIKITSDDYLGICDGLREGKTSRVLGVQFRCSYTVVQNIRNGKHPFCKQYGDNGFT